MAMTFLIGAVTAAAQDVPIPTPSATTPAPGAAPAPSGSTTPAAPAPHPPPPAPAAARLATLRVGATGLEVEDLQRALRKRGLRVAVDGEFGPATKRAVKIVQKRMRLRPTGVATPALLKRLGVRAKVAAATPTPVVLRGASPYLSVFPVAGTHTYADDFGAPRHQGRHEGVDVMAARGTPLLAVDAATVIRLSREETGLGGVSLWLERADGTQYYYAHMTQIADGLDVGSKVAVGQLVGTVGNTGDARYGAAHCHFELHPGGGAAIDPYPHLRAVDPALQTQARTAA